MKPLHEIAKDVQEGDLVRIFLRGSDYVGHRWDLRKHSVGEQLMLSEDTDLFFCGLNPFGVTRMQGDVIPVTKNNSTTYRQGPTVREKIQFVGLNLKTNYLGNEPVIGYEVIQRTSHKK